jgi:hypothetical protein
MIILRMSLRVISELSRQGDVDLAQEVMIGIESLIKVIGKTMMMMKEDISVIKMIGTGARDRDPRRGDTRRKSTVAVAAEVERTFCVNIFYYEWNRT